MTNREGFEKWWKEQGNLYNNFEKLLSGKAWQAGIQTYEQALTDPENQPSQFGTVPLEWYENLENKLERTRFKVGEVIDSLDGSYEKHALRKKLQEALE